MLRNYRKDGTLFWNELCVAPVFDRGGALLNFVGIQEDATERWQSEQALFQLASIVESSDDAIIGATLDGAIVSWNAAAERLYDYTEPEVKGSPIFRLFPVGEAEQLRQIFQRVRQGTASSRYEMTGVRKDGHSVQVALTISPVRDAAGTITGASLIVRDISERRGLEDQRNQQASQLERTNADLVRQQRALQSVLEDLQVTKIYLEEQKNSLQAANRQLGDQEQKLLATLQALRQSHQELQAAQLQLIQAEKLESIGRLAAGVAHEVKNPLAIILSGLEYLSNHVELQSGQVMVLQEMDTAVKRADGVIRGLLDFSATREVALVAQDLNTVIEQSLALVKHETTKSRVVINKLLPPDLPLVLLDVNKMQQVFVNLFINAAHAMPNGGELRIKTYAKTLDAPGGRVGRRASDCFRVGERIVVTEVADTGTGIPQEKLPKIFDPFFTTKPTGKGTGLGLTVTKNIVELHGGTIDIQNRPEGGVQVTLWLKTQEKE